MGHLQLGRDGGGDRYFLDNRPVSCGTGLELRLPGAPGGGTALLLVAERLRFAKDEASAVLVRTAAAELAERWVRVRFETEAGRPVLYQHLGGAWESWRPEPGQREGDEIQLACKGCKGKGRREPGDSCERCRGSGKTAEPYVEGRPQGMMTCPGPEISWDPVTNAACNRGVVTTGRSCTECEGSGKRYVTVERPPPPQAILRSESRDPHMQQFELRWPKASR